MTTSKTQAVRTFIESWGITASLFLMLTSLMWLPERGTFPKINYLAMLCALLLAYFHPRHLAELPKNPLFQLILLFTAYFALSCVWTSSDTSAVVLIKRQLQILLFVSFIFISGRVRFISLSQTVGAAMVFSIIMAVYEITMFYLTGGQGRLASQGALSNPLLISHIYGFFAALWLAYLMTAQSIKEKILGFLPLLPLVLLLLLTGSRTPLVALSACFLWLVLLARSRRLWLALFIAVLLASVILLLMPHLITERGVSYRPQIWMSAIAQSWEAIWFGHGLGSNLNIKIPEIEYAFSTPHNITLHVLYLGGVIGVLLWINMYISSSWSAWRYRTDRCVAMASTTVIYGLMAGMTEGGTFFSRPNEHWFLIWIPLALSLAAIDRKNQIQRST